MGKKINEDEARKMFRELILDKKTTELTGEEDWRVASMIAMFAWRVVTKDGATPREVKAAIWGATFAGMKHGLGRSENISASAFKEFLEEELDTGEVDKFTPADFIDWE